MVVAFDAVGPSAVGATSSATTLSWTHTAGTGCSHVFVGVGNGKTSAPAISSVTYGGTAMTLVGTQNSNNSTNGFAALYVLLNPPSGPSTVLVTAAATTRLTGGSISITGGGTMGAVFKAFGTTSPSSIAVTGTAVGGMVIDVVASGTGTGTIYTATGTGQTKRYDCVGDGSSAAGNSAGSTTTGAAGTTTPSYTFATDWWGAVAVFVPAATFTPLPSSGRFRVPASVAVGDSFNW